MKLVSLNIRHGGGTRILPILGWLKAQLADVILLTEWRANANGLRLKRDLEETGYMCLGDSRGPAANGLLIASTHPFQMQGLTPQTSANGTILAADLENGLRILCCYFPQRDAKRPFFSTCLDQAAQFDRPLLIIGDLNTGNNATDLEAGGAKFSCSDQFDKLTEDAGMVDLWRSSNGAHAREWTWHSSKNGFRIDHAFGNQMLISSNPNIKCWYDKSTMENGLTDHSGMILKLTGLEGRNPARL